MKYIAHLDLPHRSHHWLKDVQFAAGLVVVLGGALVLLSEILALLGRPLQG